MCIWIVGESSSNRNASRDESVETRDESIEAGEKHNIVQEPKWGPGNVWEYKVLWLILNL